MTYEFKGGPADGNVATLDRDGWYVNCLSDGSVHYYDRCGDLYVYRGTVAGSEKLLALEHFREKFPVRMAPRPLSLWRRLASCLPRLMTMR